MKFKLLLIILQSDKPISKGIFYDYLNPLSNLMIGIGAIVGLLSAIKIFKQWNTGDTNTYESVTNWFLGCIMLIVCGVALKLII